uniref:Phage protein n=1 Tax=uncultured Spirochaetaceae bacterium TaxID=201186 RepID=A0A650ENH7_9SPIO|nr:phage protein [uncultured Spirochaetaceae bacterium]
MKIYIAGKISGDKNYKAKFADAENALAKKGHSIMNPAWLVEYPEFQYGDYIFISDWMRSVCEAVVLLPDWEQSEGAKREKSSAVAERQKIFYGVDEVPFAEEA